MRYLFYKQLFKDHPEYSEESYIRVIAVKVFDEYKDARNYFEHQMLTEGAITEMDKGANFDFVSIDELFDSHLFNLKLLIAFDKFKYRQR